MVRTFAVLLALVVSLAAPGAPALKSKTPALYYPTTVGARWVFQDPGAETTFVVSKVEQKDGAVLVEVSEGRDGREVPCQEMRVSAEGLFRLSVTGRTYPTPECLLKLPHKDGQEWEFDLGMANGGISKLTAVGRESVDTPAGKFEAIRVERVGGNPATYWFAEGVGLVKVNRGGKWERILKSFTPGKK
jgi:hypothetical protein